MNIMKKSILQKRNKIWREVKLIFYYFEKNEMTNIKISKYNFIKLINQEFNVVKSRDFIIYFIKA